MLYETSKQQIHKSKGVQEMNKTRVIGNGNDRIMAEEIYRKDGYKVLVFNMKDNESKRSIGAVVEMPNGERTMPIQIPRSHVFEKKRFASAFYDTYGNWVQEDISEIEKKIKEFAEKPMPEKILQWECDVYSDIVEFVLDNQERRDINRYANIYIKDTKAFIISDKFTEFVKKHPSQLKRRQILLWLKINGKLETDANRYDKQIPRDGKNNRFIVIEMPKDKIKEIKEAA